ncbi:uncharacterized protein LOC111294479 isoform X2 [Durio zibethinus]|uniref:Uncharacterized protein LOC111294479 isoform X2 n=1 Tax=Durio zibethinus TaxID=66656 RepID=A0A6P5YSK6_DURZI|nr:uncharacterized protein LOC111294479 isoform X2 [Durio zibethinus]
MDDYCKRSGQIPAFGNWDYANELPITQYFECARQAGLIRFSSSSGESNTYVPGDLYTVDLRKHSRNLAPARKVSRVREKRREPHVKEQKKAGRVCDVTEPPRKYQHQRPHHVPISNKNNNNRTNSKQVKDAVVPSNRLPLRPPKPVDEDLYKIPPELLNSSKRKKMPGFFSCLVPACAT